ncbi:hypothetical protein O181_099156 [Austropuccinia psidii MF-1]|uniref:Uncharacterized protein n=1 Tax=Austropuccinia psidii MF-1 TaxID=1389203 RepID=A0A9Q3JCW1_9BASI|nr:hypothetical protein [Austropuccinia psidii MF-1]
MRYWHTNNVPDILEEKYIPLETQAQANTPSTPSKPEGRRGKGKRYSKGLIKVKKWPPIATQRNRKPQIFASIQGKPTLTACTGKINIINPVVTSKGKLPKSADKKFVQGTFKDTEANHTHSAIHFPIQQEPQTRGLERYGSSSSAPPTLQRCHSMEHGQQELLCGIQLGRTGSKLPEDLPQRDIFQITYDNHQRLESHQAVKTPGGERKQDKGESSNYASCRRTADPDREFPDSFRLRRSRPNQLSSRLKPFKNQTIREEERVRPNDPESVGFAERSAQEPEVVVNSFRISSPINRNITPTQIENNVVTPESNLNSDALWLQISQFAEQTP